MKKKTNTEFSDVYLDETKEKLLSAGDACLMAILHDPENELSFDEKLKRFKLREKFLPGGEIELFPEDLVELKKLVSGFPFSIIATGRICEWIDG